MGNGWSVDFWAAFQFCIQFIPWLPSCKLLWIFFPRCYQSDRFDSTCMACCPSQRNKWKRNEINSSWATELRHPEFTDSCSQTPCGDWGEEDQWGKRGLDKGNQGSLPLGRKLWATDIALSQLPNPAWESHFQTTSARVPGKNSLVPSADYKLKLAVGVKLTPSEWLQGPGGAGFCWLLKCWLPRKWCQALKMFSDP